MGAQTEPQHILVLGGTREARLLAEALAGESRFSVTYALHAPTGTVEAPKNCQLHVGSFGGTDGLAGFIEAQDVALLVNALHPHAKVMQQRFAALSGSLSIPTFGLQRPLWAAQPGDEWQHFSAAQDLTDAVHQAGHDRLFCAVGPQSMRDFMQGFTQGFARFSRRGTVFARRFDPSRGAEDGAITWIDAQPHPTLEAEIDLFETLKIQALVTKNSGGERPAKLDAAARLNLPVFLLDPPARQGRGFERWQDLLAAIQKAA